MSRSARSSKQKQQQQQLLRLAANQLQAGALDQADQLCRKLLRLAPSHFEARCLTAQIAQRRHQHAKAMQIVNQLIEQFPNRAEPSVIAGEIAQDAAGPQQAEAWFRKAAQAPDGDSSRAWLALGHGAMQRFDSEAAVVAYTNALKQRPDDPAIEAALANALTTHGLAKQAIPHYENALQAEPSDNTARAHYASTLRQIGRFDQARANYEQALKNDPHALNAIVGLIELELAVGDSDRALTLVQQALEAGLSHPDLTVSYSRLLQQAGEVDQAIAFVEQQLNNAQSMPAGYRSILHMTLGSLYEKAQQYEQAFTHYRRGNDLNPRRFEPADYEEFIGKFIKSFASDVMKTIPRSTCESAVPTCIVGMPRSGTSLTEQILGCHPNVYAAGELNRFHQLALNLPSALNASIPYPECATHITQQALDTLAQQYLDHIRALAGDDTITCITDKMPHNFMHLGLIRSVFPNARIIHVMRHPLDTCMSIYATRLSPAHSYAHRLDDIAAAYTQYRRLMAHWQTVLPGTDDWLLTLRYDDLVTDQENQTRRLLEHCRLPWDDRCLEFHKSERVVTTASMDQVRQPLHTGSVNRHARFKAHLHTIEKSLAPFVDQWHT
ncbi:MAG: tetratricopeptide repeat protein [Planctomycetes bacterium]|nr:tetratricopeptide repeat protein [Planctomycetota bacterium]